MAGRFRTFVLFLVFMMVMSAVGWFAAGIWHISPISSMLVFLILTGGINLAFYFWSDKLVLASYRAVIVGPNEAPRLHRIVDRVVLRAQIPKPRIAIIPSPAPNAFATGRNPKNAVVAATEGILNILDDEELEGVMAHEISHVKNRDTLITMVAATLAAAISFASRMIIFSRDRDMNPLIAIALLITAPIAALILQAALSRTREFAADATGAKLLGNPNALASALGKLEQGSHRHPLRMGSPATSSLFIVNPLHGGGMSRLFATHPPTKDRVRRLREMQF